ncbi:MAG: M23 family metallopeptidase [Actinomycetota bacterium]
MAGGPQTLWAPDPPYVVAEPAGMAGPQSTRRVETILRRERGARGSTASNDFLRIAGPFPVAAPSSWSNDWHAYRACPYPHLHRGLDIFAAYGAPLVAAADGHLSRVGGDATSGLAVELTDRSGVEYFYAHLSAYARGIHEGQWVRRGEVIGFVGTSGNAVGTAPHVHFEIQPGGVAMPPKPVVDRWLLEMERKARVLVRGGRDALVREGPRAAPAIGLLNDAPAAHAADDGGDPSSGTFPVGPVALVAIAALGVALEGLRVAGRRSPLARRRRRREGGVAVETWDPAQVQVAPAGFVRDVAWPDDEEEIGYLLLQK